jgi:Tfp pilus assembly protein PilZ
VRFVATGAELEALASGAKVVVAADDIQPEGAAAVARRTREGGSEAVWVVVAPPKRMVVTSRAIRSLTRVTAIDSFAPPENVLFVLNELISARGVDNRRSSRVLYGATVAFRGAGRDEDEVGFSYNISAEGLYVRTLAPPEPDQEVWIDVWPPRSERRVRLAGKVAWRRLFGEAAKAGVPPGFGVQLTDGLAGDLERWRAGYEVLRRSMMGTLV